MQLIVAEKVFRMYIKIVNNTAVVRSEESLRFKNSLMIKALRAMRNPYEEMELKMLNRLDKIESVLMEMSLKAA